MVAAWMTYALLVGAAIALAALGAERLLAPRGVPRRFVWSAAIALTLLAPVVALLRPATAPAAMSRDVVLLAPVRVVAGIPSLVLGAQAHLAQADRILLAGWALTSVLLLLRLALASRALAARRQAWRRARVDGRLVLLADDMGPSVVGALDPAIVLPRWILALEPSLRALVLAHEEEHRSARDVLLASAGALLTALLPWHLALRWQVARLRDAIEMDCDARVLRRHPDVRRYGTLLLTVAQRASVIPATRAAVALVEPATTLERRIRSMRAPRLASRSQLLIGTALLVGGTIAACSGDAPTRQATVLPEASAPAARIVKSPLVVDAPASPGAPLAPDAPPAPPAPAPARTGGAFFEFEVNRQVMASPGSGGPRYPRALRDAGVEGEVILQFVVDTSGRAEMSTVKAIRSSHADFTAAVVAHLPETRFSPAEVEGRKVRQLVQMPFSFMLNK